jgi:Uncharacterised protein conserved in bacteria (DUF2336)
MAGAATIVNEVESALNYASPEKRVDVLRRVTDLFVDAAEQFTPDQTALFDNVLEQLVAHIESRAVVELSNRLAPIAQAPAKIVERLARHDNINISGPMLAKSERLSDGTLVEIAKTKTQAHMAKIAIRARLSEAVTDVLVDNGEADVANALAVNSGARISKIGMAKLVLRADGDDRLTESIGSRADIGPHLYRQLLAQATDAVRERLVASAPASQRATIQQIMSDIAAQVTPRTGAVHRYAAAQRAMKPLSQDTDLIYKKIVEFANLKRAGEVIVGLSILGGASIEQVDRLFHAANGFGLMVLCKSMAFDWQTAIIIIMAMPAAEKLNDDYFNELHEQYAALSVTSAQRVLRFWQGRQNAVKH